MFDSIACLKPLPKQNTAYDIIQNIQIRLGILREPKESKAENDLRMHCAVHVSSPLFTSESDAEFRLNLEVTTSRKYI